MNRTLVHKDGAVHPGSIAELKSKETVWIDILDPSDIELKEVAEHTGIDAAQLREWMEGKRRPSAINFQNYSVLIFLAPIEQIKNNYTHIESSPCVVLVSNDRNDFVTIHKKELRAIQEIEHYSDKHMHSIFAKRATFLLFTLVNEIIEHYYDVLDEINERVEAAEGAALQVHRKRSVIRDTHEVKKSIIYINRSLAANREVIATVEHEHLDFLDADMIREFHILSSAITQLIEITSTYREILNTSMEIHLTSISNNLNITMKKVTSWGAIILVPSLISGIFGMNFKHFEIFEWTYGVPITIATMIASVGALYLYFKKQDWL